MTQLVDLAKDLVRACMRVKPDQLRVSRSNARKAVLAELRAVRDHLDQVYPMVAKVPAPRKARRTDVQKFRDLVRDDYAIVSGHTLEALAVQRVLFHKTKAFTLGVDGRSYGSAVWAPKWTIYLYLNGRVGAIRCYYARTPGYGPTALAALKAAVRLSGISEPGVSHSQVLLKEIVCPKAP